MRKWHRWIGLPAAIFFLLSGFTGIWLECERFFGEEEALREKLRDTLSSVSAKTPPAEFAAQLAAAQAAVAAKAGDQPLDKITWQLKGDSPTLTFYLGGTKTLKARKLILNAKTSALLREDDYDDDSFILKLHSGEIYGDGGMVLGMVWALALMALTVTGLVIYWKMRPKDATGLRKVFWLLPASLLALPAARADSPFVTDDPLFSPGWEIKFGGTAERNANSRILVAPVLDLNYAVVDNLRLNLTLQERTVTPRGGVTETGFGDTEFKVKWRFHEENTNNWVPALGLAPKFFAPTASVPRGLGDGLWRVQLPLQFGKNLARGFCGARPAISSPSTAPPPTTPLAAWACSTTSTPTSPWAPKSMTPCPSRTKPTTTC